MEIIETGIEGLLIIKPKIFGDARGFFCEIYNKKRYQDAGIMQDFCQDNLSKSTYGVIQLWYTVNLNINVTFQNLFP